MMSAGAIGGMAAIQGRIAHIQQIARRFDSLTGAGPATPLGRGEADFAATLAAAESGAGLAGSGAIVDAGAAELADIAGRQPEKTSWAVDLLGRLGMPKTRENVRALVAWQLAEGTRAAYNPLAVNRDHPGATDFNSHGVKNYPSYEAGLEETVEGFHNGLYDHILAALAAGTDARAVGEAVAESRWGTGRGVLRVLDSGQV